MIENKKALHDYMHMSVTPGTEEGWIHYLLRRLLSLFAPMSATFA